MASVDFSQIGVSGLKEFSGYIYDEWMPELQGQRGRRVIRQMHDNDPIVGGLMLAIKALIRGAGFFVTPDEKAPSDDPRVEFIEENRGDMTTTWEDTLSEIVSFLPWGFDVHETVYKRRVAGESKYTDGLIGWHSWQHRGQESIQRWEFGPRYELLGVHQLGAPDYQPHYIPAEKFLLFRTSTDRGSPEGRALESTMKIPTPHGWRQIGDLTSGDSVFDERGCVRYITARADWDERPCFRLTFADGTTIIADAAHQWVTQTQSERTHRLPGRLRTTEEIARTSKTNRGISNHSIPWTAPLDYPPQHLPLSPYLLGQWLGDGHSRSMMITCHADDVEDTCALIAADGYATQVKTNGKAEGNGRLIRVYGKQRWDASGPSAAVWVLGLMQNKHIPDAYLRGSIEQRRALLAGLMDSDGTVDQWGRCEFSNTNRNLIDGVAELVRSLGVGVTIRYRDPDKVQKRHTKSWGVRFTPPWSPFRLKRKADRIVNQHARRQHYIVACEPVAPSHTVCLEVDGPSHLFLAGEAMVPTHNSILRNAYVPWYFKTRIQKIEAIGIERDLAGLPVAGVPREILDEDATEDEVAMREAIFKIVTNIKRDDQEGVVMPREFDEHGNELWKLELLSTGGQRQFDTDKIIRRYDTYIAMTALADFLMLGHEQVGSHALSRDKTDLFVVALEAWLDVICAVINTAIVRLLALNGMSTDNPPVLQHGDIEQPNLAVLGAFLQSLASAGFEMDTTFKGQLIERLLEIASLPPNPEEVPPQLHENALTSNQPTESAPANEPAPANGQKPTTPAQP